MCKGHPPAYHLSYLTDIFALSVMYHVDRKACLSTRVSDAKAFCLRLVLMCCGLNRDELESLIPAEMTNVDLEEEDDAESLTLRILIGPTLWQINQMHLYVLLLALKRSMMAITENAEYLSALLGPCLAKFGENF